MINNKRGITTLGLLAMILLAFFLVVALGVLSYSMSTVDSVMSGLEGSLGNQSLNETYQETLGLGVSEMRTTVPQIIGTGVLLGMVLSLLFIGYKAPQMDRLWILVDIGIIICAEILAFMVSSSFTTFINSSPALLSVYRDTLPGSAKWILALPVIVPVIGTLIILATYLITKKKEESAITPGF